MPRGPKPKNHRTAAANEARRKKQRQQGTTAGAEALALPRMLRSPRACAGAHGKPRWERYRNRVKAPLGVPPRRSDRAPWPLCLAADHACCAVQQDDLPPPHVPREHTPLDTTPPAATLDEQLEGLPHEVAVDMLSFVLLDEDSEVACA